MTRLERTTQLIKNLRLEGEKIPKQINDWLQALPTVQFQAVVSALLAEQTFIMYAVSVAYDKELDAIVFGMWLGFVAAYGGIAYKQFKTKRETYNPNISSRQNNEVQG
jgi:hypothetical protein